MRKKSEFKLLSPADAREMLQLNTHNRRLNERNVLVWAEEMEQGRWRSNGESIKISESNVLLDGQNRLSALALQAEDMRLEFLIVSGLPDEVQSTMDQGESRSLAQQLTLSAIEADKPLAAALRQHLLWTKGFLFLDSKNSRRYTTAPAMVDYAKNHTATLDLMRMGRRYRQAPLKESLTLTAFAVISEQHSVEGAMQFFQGLLDGVNLAPGSPVLALRNRLINIRADRTRVTNQTLLGYVVQAFNAWSAGRPMSKVQRPKDGYWTAENFPKVKPPKGNRYTPGWA
jgi:hypothetical protein